MRLLVCALVSLLGSCTDATAPVVPSATTLVPGTGTVAFTALGQTRSLTATVLDQTGAAMTGAPLTFSSSADTVVTISAAGVATAVGNGTATLTVSSGAATAQIAASVAQVPASMQLSTAATTFAALGDTLRLSATVQDGGGSAIVGAAVAWTVGDTMVATVADGLVTAVGNGTTYVFAVSGASLASAQVTVAQSPSAIVLSADSLALSALGDTATLAAVVNDGGGSPVFEPVVGWASSDTLVAKVTPSGLVTAVANGAAVVTATSGTALAQAQVSVRQVAASLTLLPDSVVLKDPGDTAQLTVSAWDAGGSAIASPDVSWMSADVGVAGVDNTGLVTAVGTGTVTISADVDGTLAQGSARVEPEVTLLPAGPTVLFGEVATQLSLSVRVEDLLGGGYGGTTISWSAPAGSGAITSGATTTSGATGHGGAVWVLDTLAGPQQAFASIASRGNVVQVAFSATALAGPAVSAALVADSILLSGRGETAFLGATYTDQYGNVTASGGGAVWQSRDPGVASASPSGLVTAVDPGATYVVASLGAPTDSLLVTVSLRGAVTVTFDDGFLEAYTSAFPAFQAVGLRGNIAVNPAQVGFPAYMTKAQLDEVHAAGFSIVSHTMTHDTLTTLTVGELDYELRTSQEWIDAQGYNGGNVFIVPFHLWGARERDAIGLRYEATRGTPANAVSPDSLASWRPSNPYDLTGIEGEDLPYTTLAGRDRLRDLLQRTADEGAFLDVFFHHLPPANVADFEATLAVIDEFRDRVLPYHELYPRFARSVF